jgi:hypothetical protein
MSKRRFFTLILSAHILFYFFKIDRDLNAFQDIIPHPHQTYNEQPLIEHASYLFISISDISKFSDQANLKNNHKSIWHSILLSYNSKLINFQKINKACTYNVFQIVSVLFKKNIYHKSSIDGELFHRIST